VGSDYRAKSGIGGRLEIHTELPADDSRARVLIHLLSHLLIPLLALPFGFLSDRLGWSPQIGESLKLLSLMGLAVVLGAFALGRLLRSTHAKPGARKKAVAEFLGVPDEREPEQSRRLWQGPAVTPRCPAGGARA
jgi:hypothetical protein